MPQNPDENFDPKELAIGTLVEMEHTDDPNMAEKIAKDHLRENPDYYKKLADFDEGAREAREEVEAGKENQMAQRSFTNFQFAGVNEKTNVLEGVIVCEEGEAKGHGLMLTKDFLKQVVALCVGRKLKVRMDHPEEGKPGRLLSIIGEAFNFRMDGNKVRADVKLFDLPASEHLKKLAQQASDLFGMSIDFVGKVGKKLANGLETISCREVHAVDFVESPAATSSLFHRLVDSTAKVGMTISVPQRMMEALGLDADKTDEKTLVATLEGLIEKVARYEEKPEGKEQEPEPEKKMAEEAKPEEKKDETKDEFEGLDLAAMDPEKLGRLCKLVNDEVAKRAEEEKKEEPKDEVKAEEGKEDEEKKDVKASSIEEQVTRLAAKAVTDILAKAGIKPVAIGTAPVVEQEFKLTEEQENIAKKLGIDRKEYAVKLQAISKK